MITDVMKHMIRTGQTEKLAFHTQQSPFSLSASILVTEIHHRPALGTR